MKETSFKNHFYTSIQPQEWIIIYLILGCFIFGLLAILINALTYQYQGNDYFPSEWIAFIPVTLGLLFFSLRTLHITPRLSFFTKTYCFFFFIIACQAILLTGIQYTPFPVIDTALVKADKILGFDTLAVLNWTYEHTWFAKLMWMSYNGWVYQLVILPLILGLLIDNKAIERFFLSFLIATLLGAFIYYFWPTAAPSSVFQNSHFNAQQVATSLKFYEIHHYQKPSTTLGGMIAMPSFHVTCALLFLYSCRHRRRLFWILIPINVLIILSTVCLGWHYLMDVIGAFLLVGFSIFISRILIKKCDTQS